MTHEWQQLTELTGGREIEIERVRIKETGIVIEGQFSLPPLAGLSAEDQVFLAAFVRSHGSIKEMERLFGISYPTVKNRLNKLGAKFDFIDLEVTPESDNAGVIARLERGEIDVTEALNLLHKGESDE